MDVKNSMSADEFQRLNKQGVFKAGKKGRVSMQELLPEYKELLKKENKFNAKKVVVGNDIYDSKKELKFEGGLKLQMLSDVKSERVTKIERQIRYDITVNGVSCGFYKLDFRITYADDNIRYFDVKGCKKGCAYSHFRLKKKLVQALYGITIEEV